MPLYEFICDDCGKEFEKMVRFSDANQPQDCPSCKSQETHKKISKVASFGASMGGGLSSSSSCGSGGGFG